MTDESREVNIEEEKKPEEKAEEEPDEEIIPADPLGEKSQKTQTSESSPEEPVKEEPPKEDETLQAKPVDGETLRERALRKEVERLRAENRKSSIKVIAPQEQKLPDKSKEELEALGYSEDEISNMEKVIDILAEKKGYVKKSHTYQESVNQVLNDFLEEHPKYKPENDEGDKHWAKFQEVLSNDYNIVGKTPKQIKDVFKKVNRDIEEFFGEESEDNSRKIEAQKQKVQAVSHSGGTKTQTSSKKTIDPAIKAMFKGFDDEDLE